MVSRKSLYKIKKNSRRTRRKQSKNIKKPRRTRRTRRTRRNNRRGRTKIITRKRFCERRPQNMICARGNKKEMKNLAKYVKKRKMKLTDCSKQRIA